MVDLLLRSVGAAHCDCDIGFCDCPKHGVIIIVIYRFSSRC